MSRVKSNLHILDVDTFLKQFVDTIDDFMLKNRKLSKNWSDLSQSNFNSYTQPFQHKGIAEDTESFYNMEKVREDNNKEFVDRNILVMHYSAFISFLCMNRYFPQYTEEDMKNIKDKNLKIYEVLLRSFMYLIQHNIEVILFFDEERRSLNHDLLKITVFYWKALYDFREMMFKTGDSQEFNHEYKELLRELLLKVEIDETLKQELQSYDENTQYDKLTESLLQIIKNMNALGQKRQESVSAKQETPQDSCKGITKVVEEIKNGIDALKIAQDEINRAHDKNPDLTPVVEQKVGEFNNNMNEFLKTYRFNTSETQTESSNACNVDDRDRYIFDNQQEIKGGMAQLRNIATELKEDILGAVRVIVKIRPVNDPLKQKSLCFRISDKNTIKDSYGTDCQVDECCDVVDENKQTGGDSSDNAFCQPEQIITPETHSYKMITAKNIAIESSNKEKEYGPFFDVVNTKKTNQDVFCSLNTMFDKVLDGDNVVMFGYGYSGSGKTYTLLGSDTTEGVLSLAIKYFVSKNAKITCTKVNEFYLDTKNFRVSSEAMKVNGKFIGLFNNYIRDNEVVHVNGIEYPNYEREENTTYKLNEKIEDVKDDINRFNNEKNTGILNELLKTILFGINEVRKSKLRIKETINNKESSRSHLFLHFDIMFENSKGSLVVCDMAGREDPLDIFNKSEVSFNKQSLKMIDEPITDKPNRVFGAKFQSLLKYYMPGSSEWWKTKQKNFTAAQTSLINNLNPKWKNDLLKDDKTMRKVAEIFDTCVEGILINESINHLTWFLQKNNGIEKKVPMWPQKPDGVKSLNDSFAYDANLFMKNPSNEFGDNIKKTGINVGMIPYLQKIQSVPKTTTRFVMLACIRSDDEKKFMEFNQKTLDFAQSISSGNFNKNQET